MIAFSCVGTLIAGLIWREVMEPTGGAALDLSALAAEHGRTMAAGVLLHPPVAGG